MKLRAAMLALGALAAAACSPSRSPVDDIPTPTGTDGGRVDAGDAAAGDAGGGDGGVPVEGADAGIRCGAANCGSGEVCCVDPGPTGAARCVDPSKEACINGRLTCSRPGHCRAAEVCCGTGPTGSVHSANCAASCTGGSVPLCGTNADCNASTCSPIPGDPKWLSSCK